MANATPSKLGEFGWIDTLRRGAGQPQGRWLRGIGDDAAVLRPRAGRDLVLSTDALVQDVHFRWSTTDGASLGRKALAVSVSDLAAMGARPLGFLLSIGLPARVRAAALDGFVRGLIAESRRTDCPLVGGDTVRAEQWVLSLTVLGEVVRGRALLRSGARPGDRVFVTGALGGAALGLALLESGRGRGALARPFVRRQLQPQARLAAGLQLAMDRLASAAIDLSDGLLADAGHIAEQSGVRLDLQAAALPLPRGLRAQAGRIGRDPLQLAAAGGEDYELLFCARGPGASARVLRERLGVPVTEIGRVLRGRGVRLLSPDGAQVHLPTAGFEHFKRSARRSDK